MLGLVKVELDLGSIWPTNKKLSQVLVFPQFSAVLEVAAAIKGSGVHVIADWWNLLYERYLEELNRRNCVMLGSFSLNLWETPGRNDYFL
jgi:hypothetical protein